MRNALYIAEGPPAFRKRVPAPQIKHRSQHVPIAKYAGNPLYRLCPSVPYILGPLPLVSRLQVIVEQELELPNEVKRLATRNGVDVTSLTEFDVALLIVLGLLWDD